MYDRFIQLQSNSEIVFAQPELTSDTQIKNSEKHTTKRDMNGIVLELIPSEY